MGGFRVTGKLASFCVTLALLSLSAGCGEREPATPPPGTSLLLITLDTTRRDVISSYGADPRITPNLAKFALGGSLFLNAHAQANVTNPSHVTIMTGLPAIEHGVFNNFVPIPEHLDTLPLAFQRAGFETAGFPAVAHVGEQLGWLGFDEFAPAGLEIDAAEVTERMLAWLRERRSPKPFFAWLHYFDPHSLYEAPAEIRDRFYDGDPFAGPGPPLAEHPYFERAAGGPNLAKWIGKRRDPEYPRAMYTAEVHYVDRELGRVFRYLQESGLAESTVVVIVADHGESITEHGVFFGHSGLYETQLRIPLIVKVPGFPEGVRARAMVSQLDLAPTLMDLFGISLQHETRGRSLVPLLRGGTSDELESRDSLIHEAAHNNQVALRRGKWKLIWPINRDHPIIPNVPLLFDLEADPDELRNLAAEMPARTEEMAAELKLWQSLGEIPRGELTHLSEEQLRQLKTLGYVP